MAIFYGEVNLALGGEGSGLSCSVSVPSTYSGVAVLGSAMSISNFCFLRRK